MAKARVGAGLVAGCLLVWGSVACARAAAAPTPAQILSFRPRQEGVSYSTPTPQEVSLCKVEPVKWGRQGGGWLLRDPQGKPLRRFYNTRYTGSSDDKSKMDIWCYYQDGVEVYREWASRNGGPADQFRWMNAGGMKWGVDENGDGKIDHWKMISLEEVGQELLQAVLTRDSARFQALLVSDAELKAMDLPAAEANRARQLRAGATAKFQAACSKLGGTDPKAVQWLHVEIASPPQCVLADQTGAKHDFIRHSGGVASFMAGSDNKFLQTGELLQVGLAWRLVDGPTEGQPDPMTVAKAQGAAPDGMVLNDKELKGLIEQLQAMDSRAPQSTGGGPNPEVVRFQLARADLLEKIVAKVKPEERDPWIRQVADCLSSASQSSAKNETTAYQRLVALEKQIVPAMPAGSALAGYVVFREISADYARKVGDKNFDTVQKEWIEKLTAFVKAYPSVDDTPDALIQLGMVSELTGKEVEAKNWYKHLADTFPERPQGKKAAGAVERLSLEGKVLQLSGPVLGSSSTTFDISRDRGKVVVVYYWASWNGQTASDFAKLKQLVDAHPGKVEVVGVNLDSTVSDALDFLKKTPAPGTHLFQEGGLESPLATQYGIMVLPHLFLVDAQGKVVSRTVQIANLEEEVKKLLK
ncbi:MAG TPA: thioredoxin-like domain-containing protein [Gemmataceae bacterium]|nr:thioredoxin-like domain-containing protein [Gemmataceae bacterium]